MRLINAKTLRLEEFLGSRVPQYAILSHTWEDEEVTFQEMVLAGGEDMPPPTKRGFEKIRETCRLALEMSFEYVWVDTCCIDKSSSAELTESINSMFEWYKNAAICFAYLSDLDTSEEFASGIKACRWLTRGWTLQELLAPETVQFYDKTWQWRSTKSKCRNELSEATGIPDEVLCMDYASVMGRYSVAQRMSWAARRQTTRTEDMAYCLLGIFQVNMPLIYGEGSMAFQRLQEEIIKRNNDLSILAWNPDEETKLHIDGCSLLAPSPAVFLDSGTIIPWPAYSYNPEFTITNKGLRIDDHLCTLRQQREYFLRVAKNKAESGSMVVIYLLKIGPNLFVRQSRKWVCLQWDAEVSEITTSTLYIIANSFIPNAYDLALFRKWGLFVPFAINFSLPAALWNLGDSFFYNDYPHNTRVINFHQKISSTETIEVMALIRTLGLDDACFLFEARKHQELKAYLVRKGDRDFGVGFHDLVVDYPEIRHMSNKLKIRTDSKDVTIMATLVYQKGWAFGHSFRMRRLQIEMRRCEVTD